MASMLSYTSPWQLAGLPKSSSVLLAFSGGADSRALLHLLCQSAKEDGFGLILAHVNHGIRGAESLRDRDFCVRVAKELGLEICVLDADVPTLATSHGRSLEEEAREVRYAFFARLMEERGIPLLATAHHADDNLETLLFRLARGTATRGLCGIAPVRPFASGMLTRPLLKATRRQILELCREQGLEFVTDSTNAEPTCSRNRLRHEVIPVMEELFESPQERISQTCEQLREDESLLSAMAEELLRKEKGKDGLRVSSLLSVHPAIRRRALASYLCATGSQGVEQHNLNAVLDLVEQDRNGGSVTLPGGLFATVEAGTLRVLPRTLIDGCEPFKLSFTHGETILEASGVTILVEKGEKNTNVHNLSTAASTILNLSSVIIEGSLFWRSRREGDTVRMGGMTRRLRKLYNQKQIPVRLRERLPLLCDAEGVVWAPFVGARDGAEDPDSDLCIRVTVADL